MTRSTRDAAGWASAGAVIWAARAAVVAAPTRRSWRRRMFLSPGAMQHDNPPTPACRVSLRIRAPIAWTIRARAVQSRAARGSNHCLDVAWLRPRQRPQQVQGAERMMRRRGNAGSLRRLGVVATLGLAAAALLTAP